MIKSVPILALLLSYPAASAEQPVFKLGLPDFGYVAISLGLQNLAQIRYHDMPPATPDMLDRQDLSRIDRWAAGNYSKDAAVISDILIVSGVVAPMAITTLESLHSGAGLNPVFTEAVIFSEALAISSSLNLLVRSLRIHPRPLVYGSDAPEDEKRKGEASGSFYSGHANGAFLAATYLAYTYPLRHPEFQHKEWLWAGSLGAAAAVAGLRVAAGKHFTSDVVVGAAAGAFFGWAFPRMHLTGASERRAQLRLLPIHEGIHPVLVVRF